MTQLTLKYYLSVLLKYQPLLSNYSTKYPFLLILKQLKYQSVVAVPALTDEKIIKIGMTLCFMLQICKQRQATGK